MTPEQRFLAEGAEAFGNRLIFKHKDVGLYSSSGMSLTLEGEETLAKLDAITDVVAKEPKAAKLKKAEKPVDDVLDTSDLDSLLGRGKLGRDSLLGQ